MSRLGLMAAAGLALISGLAGSATAAGRAECLAVGSRILGEQVKYCVILPPSYDQDPGRRYPVLYFLHGLGDSEQMFLRAGGMNLIGDLWEQGKIAEFLVVTPAAGTTFYLNSRDGRRRYEDFFVKEFIPAVERRYRVAPGRAHRGLAGISMGGYGSLHLAFAHPELVGSVSAHSAALVEKIPGGAGPNASGPRGVFGGVFGSPFDPAYWNRNSPLTLASMTDLRGVRIYFDCGTDDDYGFYAGAQALDRVLRTRHVPHEFHLDPGAHDWAYFASHLPGSLEFHSRAFGWKPR